MLSLGKSFDREYKIQVPFLDGFYNVGVFFNKKSSFVLLSVDSDFRNSTNYNQTSAKVNMFKNLESSKFCETFLKLHSYRGTKLDIVNQFHEIKPEYSHDVNFILNETINLAKYDVDGKELYETLTVYGLTLTPFINEFVYLIVERQNIVRKLNKKVVRTTAVQLATSASLNLLNEYYNESKDHSAFEEAPPVIKGDSSKVLKMSDEEREATK